MANVDGIFNRRTVWDRRGKTHNRVGGFGNTVDFRGDHGKNRFNIGGQMNNVQVHNLGRDDRVNLEGPGWQELPDANSRDGIVRYYNNLTGSFAEVHTDNGRNDNFVRNRVRGANGACCCNNWNMIGNSAGYMAGYYAGQADGYGRGHNDGYRQANYDNGFNFGQFLSGVFLGPLAWAL